jgi:hypothetical protein
MYADAPAILIGHPGATFSNTELTPHLFFNFFTSSRRDVHRYLCNWICMGQMNKRLWVKREFALASICNCFFWAAAFLWDQAPLRRFLESMDELFRPKRSTRVRTPTNGGKL